MGSECWDGAFLMMTLGFVLRQKRPDGAGGNPSEGLGPARFDFEYPVRVASRVTNSESEGDERRYLRCVSQV